MSLKRKFKCKGGSNKGGLNLNDNSKLKFHDSKAYFVSHKCGLIHKVWKHRSCMVSK